MFLELTTHVEDLEKDTLLGGVKYLKNGASPLEKKFFEKGIERKAENIEYVDMYTNPDPEVTVLRPRWTDHTHIVGLGHLFTEKAIAIIKSFDNSNSEFYPVNIMDNSKVINPKKYFVANFTMKLDCLDKEKSEIEKIGKSTYIFDQLVFDYDKIPAAVKIFVLDISPDYVFFHQDIISKLAKENITGIVWRKIEDITM